MLKSYGDGKRDRTLKNKRLLLHLQCRSEGYVELGSVDRKIALAPLSLYLFQIYFWITAIKREFTIFLPTPSTSNFLRL